MARELRKPHGRFSATASAATAGPDVADKRRALPGLPLASPAAAPELIRSSIAHVDCDAFYATIEKRDDPSLADKPVIVGGRQRGVVLTCCYVARTYGVRSAMPIFEARRLCPHAAYVPPEHGEICRASAREVRALMRDLTPLVEPVSIDEAFMDLSGTERLHGVPPAKTLADFRASGSSASSASRCRSGLSGNKFLAKIASDLDKPRGFAVLARRRGRGLPGAAAGHADFRRRQGRRRRASARTASRPSAISSASARTS